MVTLQESEVTVVRNDSNNNSSNNNIKKKMDTSSTVDGHRGPIRSKKVIVEKQRTSEEELSKKLKWFYVRYQGTARYLFVDSNKYGLVMPNVIMFFAMHIYFVYAMYILFKEKRWNSWIFVYIYGMLSGLGVTVGAHRLWSHRAYDAKAPLRFFLMILHTMAGQNDLFTWIRDHRLHHKFSETDADPHNSRRGIFFAHVGWLLTKKHPDVLIKGKTIDCSDVIRDPVVKFQRKFYVPLYFTFRLIVPLLLPVYFWNEKLEWAFIGVFAQYIASLHCTWFVNSAAHLFGDRPYNEKIQPRENPFVNFAAMGEGFHNFHHTFPWDYRISEIGFTINPYLDFLEFMAKIGQAYNLRKASKELISERKFNAAKTSTSYLYVEDHPYNNPHEFAWQ